MINYLILAGVIFGLGLLPAFGPPSWTALVLMYFQLDLAAIPSVVVAAIATTLGRVTLALGTRLLRSRLSENRRQHLSAISDAIRRRRVGAFAGLSLFLVSPLPSAQLWEAAGLLEAPLMPIALAFAVGRLVSSALYISAAHVVHRSLGSVITDQFTSPVALAVNAGLILMVVLIARINWLKVLGRESPAVEPSAEPGGQEAHPTAKP